MIGGTGLLGKTIKRYRDDIICFGRDKDIFDFKELEMELDKIQPDIIINAAAILSEKVDENKESAINVNIIGSSNVAKYCIKNNIRLVYISSDYIYSGKKGNYNETDEILPRNLYAWTKLAGECATKMAWNHLIIRTSFGPSDYPYAGAYDNLYVSKDYVDIISDMIIKVLDVHYIGVLNIGTERKSIYKYACKRNLVKKIKLDDDLDFSLNTELYKEITNNDR